MSRPFDIPGAMPSDSSSSPSQIPPDSPRPLPRRSPRTQSSSFTNSPPPPLSPNLSIHSDFPPDSPIATPLEIAIESFLNNITTSLIQYNRQRQTLIDSSGDMTETLLVSSTAETNGEFSVWLRARVAELWTDQIQERGAPNSHRLAFGIAGDIMRFVERKLQPEIEAWKGEKVYVPFEEEEEEVEDHAVVVWEQDAEEETDAQTWLFCAGCIMWILLFGLGLALLFIFFDYLCTTFIPWVWFGFSTAVVPSVVNFGRNILQTCLQTLGYCWEVSRSFIVDSLSTLSDLCLDTWNWICGSQPPQTPPNIVNETDPLAASIATLSSLSALTLSVNPITQYLHISALGIRHCEINALSSNLAQKVQLAEGYRQGSDGMEELADELDTLVLHIRELFYDARLEFVWLLQDLAEVRAMQPGAVIRRWNPLETTNRGASIHITERDLKHAKLILAHLTKITHTLWMRTNQLILEIEAAQKSHASLSGILQRTEVLRAVAFSSIQSSRSMIGQIQTSTVVINHWRTKTLTATRVVDSSEDIAMQMMLSSLESLRVGALHGSNWLELAKAMVRDLKMQMQSQYSELRSLHTKLRIVGEEYDVPFSVTDEGKGKEVESITALRFRSIMFAVQKSWPYVESVIVQMAALITAGDENRKASGRTAMVALRECNEEMGRAKVQSEEARMRCLDEKLGLGGLGADWERGFRPRGEGEEGMVEEGI